MKNTIYIALIFIGLYACEPEPYNAEIKYLIFNASNHNIELTFFHMPESKDTIFFLSPDSIIEYNSIAHAPISLLLKILQRNTIHIVY